MNHVSDLKLHKTTHGFPYIYNQLERKVFKTNQSTFNFSKLTSLILKKSGDPNWLGREGWVATSTGDPCYLWMRVRVATYTGDPYT